MHLFRWRLRRPRRAGEFLLEKLAVERNSRFLIIAPHSDDEILGAGGLMYMAAQAGCAVHVAMLTNGDGYNRAALGGQSRRWRPTPARAIAFAYERQRETLQALERLGLDADSLTFLGYPDRGLIHMWDRHWQSDMPYRSRFTGATHSPYDNSFTPNAPFSGMSLVADLEHILGQFQPTHIVVPHPNDFHGDHWAGCCFTLYALERLRTHGNLRTQPIVLQYLVHQGPWPRPRGFRPGLGLQPPVTYAGLRFPWVTLPLTRAAVAHKHDALLCYRSQMVFMRTYLLSFVRSNELFGVLQPIRLPVVANGQIVVDGDTSDWTGVAEVLYPMRDSLAKRVGRSADIKAVRVCRDDAHLYLRMELRHRAVDDYLYGITLHGMAADGGVGRARLGGASDNGRTDHPGRAYQASQASRLSPRTPSDRSGRFVHVERAGQFEHFERAGRFAQVGHGDGLGVAEATSRFERDAGEPYARSTQSDGSGRSGRAAPTADIVGSARKAQVSPPDRRRLYIGMRVPDRLQLKGEGGWEGMTGIVGRAGNRELEVALPLAALAGSARLFLGVETRYRGIIIDRPALQLLDLTDSG